MEQEQRTLESRYLLEFLQVARSQKQTVGGSIVGCDG